MANDFLDDVEKDAAKAMKSTDSSPYRLKKEGSKTAQIRTSTYKTVKLIAFEEERKMIVVFDDLIRIGLYDDKYKKNIE